MKPLKKVILIIVITLVSAYLFSLFVLVSFPYHALVDRADAELRSAASAHLAMQEVFFRYPLTFELREVSLLLQGGTSMTADRVVLRARPRLFSPYREVEARAWGMGVRSEIMELSGLEATINSRVRVRPLLEGALSEGMHSLGLSLGRADIDRVTLAGFEFTSLALRQARVGLAAEEGWFALREGTVTADVVTARLSGRISPRQIEVGISVRLTEEFYRRYRDLQGLADSFFTDGSLEITLRGMLENPDVRFNEGTAR